MRSSLVAALVSCVNDSFRNRTRRFLVGLSSDELQFIAEYLGACILESNGECIRSRSELAGRIAEFQQARGSTGRVHCEDQEHKMILLLEYLCQTGRRGFPAQVRTV